MIYYIGKVDSEYKNMDMQWFLDMQKTTNDCRIVATKLLTTLQSNDELKKTKIILPDLCQSHCFRVSGFSTKYPFVKVSVSVPPDAMGNRGAKFNEGTPSTYETALIDSEDNLTYIEELGYDDIRRFWSVEELVEELIRLSKC